MSHGLRLAFFLDPTFVPTLRLLVRYRGEQAPEFASPRLPLTMGDLAILSDPPHLRDIPGRPLGWSWDEGWLGLDVARALDRRDDHLWLETSRGWEAWRPMPDVRATAAAIMGRIEDAPLFGVR